MYNSGVSQTLTIGGAVNATFSGAIAAATASNLSLTMNGPNTQVLGGACPSPAPPRSTAACWASTAAAASTAVAVNAGGAWAARHHRGAVTVAAGLSPSTYGQIDLVDGTIGTLKINSTLATATASAYSVLDLEFGAAAASTA